MITGNENAKIMRNRNPAAPSAKCLIDVMPDDRTAGRSDRVDRPVTGDVSAIATKRPYFVSYAIECAHAKNKRGAIRSQVCQWQVSDNDPRIDAIRCWR